MRKLYKLRNKLKVTIYKFLLTVMNTSDYAMWQQDEYGNWIYSNEERDVITG